MLLYIAPSLIQYFEENGLADIDVEALENIISSHRNGSHYVFANRRSLEYLSNIQNLSFSCKQQIKMLSHDYTTLSSFPDLISNKIIVKPPTEQFKRIDTVNDTDLDNYKYISSIFEIPLHRFNDSELVEKTKLVSEHLDDCHFYEFLANKFSGIKDLPFSMSFDLLHGGGNDTHRILEEKVLNNHLAVALVDSDKKAPTDIIGVTGKQVLEVFENYSESNIFYCEVLPFHEKENLFSTSIYEKFGENVRGNAINQLKILEEQNTNSLFLPYLDLKEGLHSGNFCSYFEPLFEIPKLIPTNEVEKRGFEKEFIGSKEEFMAFWEEQKLLPKKDKEIKYLIEPLGNNPLRNFNLKNKKNELEKELETMSLHIPEIIKEKLRIKLDIVENMPDYLLDFQKYYFNILGTQLKEWGLANFKRSAS